MAQIDLDELLHGTPAWDAVVAFWKDGEFHEEHYLVSAIRRHLLTADQRQQLFDRDISIEDVLNGRTEGQHEAFVQSLFDAWNERLGFRSFGF